MTMVLLATAGNTAKQLAAHIVATCNSVFRKLRRTRAYPKRGKKNKHQRSIAWGEICAPHNHPRLAYSNRIGAQPLSNRTRISTLLFTLTSSSCWRFFFLLYLYLCACVFPLPGTIVGKRIRQHTEKKGKEAPVVAPSAAGPSTEEAERLRRELQAEVEAAKEYRESLQM